MLNLHSIEPVSEIYGPGKRFVIWTQGCNLNCKGCWNKETWSFKDNLLYSPNDLLNLVLKYIGEVEGITILGGEPLLQKIGLLKFIKLIKKNTNLTIMLYTGFEETKFTMKDKEIISYIDILIAGRYVEEKRNIFLTWRGSENQKIKFITNKYTQKDIPPPSNMLEINIDTNGAMKLMGYPEKDFIDLIKNL